MFGSGHIKKLLLFLTSLLVSVSCLSDVSQKLNIKTQSGTVNTYPYQARFPNGSLTDNLDGTVSINSAIAGSPSIVSGANVQYNFLEATGTVLTDLSGNGNDGALCSDVGSGKPAWLSNGLAFHSPQQCANIAAAANADKTYVWDMYLNPINVINGHGDTNQYPLVFTNSAGISAGINVLYAQDVGGQDGDTVPKFGIYSGSYKTHCNLGFTGYHGMAIVIGTGSSDLDRIYIDGTECTSYDAHTFTSAFLGTGNMQIGTNNTGTTVNSGFSGIMYNFAAYSVQLSSSQIVSDLSAFKQATTARGGIVSPLTYLRASNTILVPSDSIACGYPLTGNCPVSTTGQPVAEPAVGWAGQLSLPTISTFTVLSFGLPGITALDASYSEPWRAAQYCQTQGGLPVLAVVALGTNDFINNPSSQTVLADLVSEGQTLKSAGCVTVLVSIISRTGTDGQSLHTMDYWKDTMNAVERQQYKAMGYSGFIDMGASLFMGPDNAYSNTTYFNADGIHATALGQTMMASVASNALNYFYGAVSGNPTVVTSTYTMLSSDVQVIVSSATPNQTLTLPDCTGPSGSPYYIVNNSTNSIILSSSSTVQPVNLSTTTTLSANTPIHLTDTPKAASTGGCYWTTQ